MVLGTPLYMSPEQAQLNNLDVDTLPTFTPWASCLQALTGTTPLQKQLKGRPGINSPHHSRGRAAPPQHKTELSKTLAALAASRHTEPARYQKLVRELD